MTTGSTSVVSGAAAMQRSLRSTGRRDSRTTHADPNKEVTLIHEEEKIMDEEVTSEEDVDEASEEAALAVALVNSVAQSEHSSDEEEGDDVDDSKKPYSLRKRRRPTGQDLERLEHFQSSKEGGLARQDRSGSISPKASVPEAPTPNPTPAPSLLPQPDITASSPMYVPNPLSSRLNPSALVLPSTALDDSDITKKVKISSPELGSTIPNRLRGFSIDMDSTCFDFPDDGSAPAGADLPMEEGRGRAFSFECFAFGISADEPLPPLEVSASTGTGSGNRLRGDSIIFDPASFQDGGIHEKTALEKSDDEQSDLPRKFAATSSPTLVVSRVTPMVPISTSLGVPAMAPVSATSLSMDLLNKDGRIGIYLPEARRARIARFHAKRAKRVWRKRIKYDCRKKLADSRPRIKGRFVKRSDVEE